jgi:hypothetical protein
MATAVPLSLEPPIIKNVNYLAGGNKMSKWDKQVIEEFRANSGKVGGYFAKLTRQS